MIKYFERNTIGRDFVVGDIHGEFDILREKLKEIEFDEDKDRLFSVGDLVDRGPKSEEFYKWLDKPWFHAVRGNHEQMMIDAFEYGVGSSEEQLHYMNGGDWFFGRPSIEQQCYTEIAKEMPTAIEIDHEVGKVGIVHAEVFKDWEIFKNRLNEHHIYMMTIWGRGRLHYKDETFVENVSRIYVGHSYVEEPTQLGNTYYLDTGSCFKGGKLTVMEIK